MQIREVEKIGKNRFFKILNYKFMICKQFNKNLDLKYCIDMYDEEKSYYKTIGYCNTIQEGKVNAIRYLAKIL
jgi:hypothetical protein